MSDAIHTFTAIFRDEKTAYALSQFDSDAIKEIEAALFNKNGKAYLKCLATGKERQAKPEEVVRQLWIQRLTKHYHYPVTRLNIEYPITFGRDTSKRADIVVFDKDRPTVPYLIVEVKKIKEKEGKEQLKSYCHATGAPLALWSNGADTLVWHRKNPNYFVEIPELPAASQTIEDVAGQPWDISTLIKLEKERESKGIRARSLKYIITDMEDEVLANAGVDVFEEVFKLIFTKLYDELSVYSGRYKHLRFRNTNTAAELRDRIQSLFEEASQKWEGVFPVGDRIKLTPDHLQVCIGSLEEYKLFNSNLDIIDEAFEYLVNKSSKGEKGQYFTPRWVIDMCVKMLNPQENESLIDTACGSAGFTMHAIFKVWRDILDSEGLEASHLFTLEKKPERCYDYVRDKVFAIDFDEKSVRVARCLNLIAGDGQTNVLHLNTLDWKKWDETVKDQNWQDVYHDGWKKLRKLVADPKMKDFRSFGFDVLMANPPFAGDIKQTDLLSSYDLGHKENGKYESKVGRDLLFIERNLDFLKPGGRMAIVLPQGRFNNASDKRVRQYIAERCRILAVVGLHPNTFKPHTGTKTSVLFVQKWNDDPNAGPLCPMVDDYNIFFATQKLESKDTSGDKVFVTKDVVSIFELNNATGQQELIKYDREDFLTKYGSIKAAIIYQFRQNGKLVRMNLEQIEERFGGLDMLENPVNMVMPIESKELIRDFHGHWIVQHDLFNHDGKTQDGVAEAFVEFAKKEKLGFFP